MNWYVANTSNGHGLIVEEVTGRNVAVSYVQEDANLIAAAPQMYAALKMAVESGDEYAAFKACQAAMAKAEGAQ